MRLEQRRLAPAVANAELALADKGVQANEFLLLEGHDAVDDKTEARPVRLRPLDHALRRVPHNRRNARNLPLVLLSIGV